MPVFPHLLLSGNEELLDALCRRRCSFALWRLPGKQSPVAFCMQEDGMISRVPDDTSPGSSGFLAAPWDSPARWIASERETLPEPSGWEPWCPDAPASPETTRHEYHRLFSLYHSRLTEKAGGLSKLVLARTRDIPVRDFSVARAFRKACRRSPLAFNALIHCPEVGTWLCSTPELLLSGEGERWQTIALAGTRLAGKAGGEPWDDKNRQEQALVEQHLRRCLEPLAREMEVKGPFSLTAGPVEHLCSVLTFRPSTAHPLRALLQLLPPTPAVCGYPVQEAKRLLRQHPDIQRGCYAGYLGPVCPGRVQLYVTLRCMQVFPGFCRLYAGGGLMPDSQEATEWEETNAKMRVMAALLN